MTRITISLIVTVLFIVVSLSTAIILCKSTDEKTEPDTSWYEDWKFCKLKGNQPYFGTEKLSDPFIAGLIAGVLVFLVSLTIVCIIFPGRKVVRV